MNFIMMWVVVIAAGTNRYSPTISTPYVDYESCQRVLLAANPIGSRTGTCVEVKVAVPK